MMSAELLVLQLVFLGVFVISLACCVALWRRFQRARASSRSPWLLIPLAGALPLASLLVLALVPSTNFLGCVLLPATLMLIFLAFRGNAQTRFIIVQGALAGLLAAVVYDLFRMPFVLAGKPLFGVFPQFGQLLLYGQLVKGDESLPVQIAGWAYHFQNGMALGIMGAAMIPLSAAPRARFWACVRKSRDFLSGNRGSFVVLTIT